MFLNNRLPETAVVLCDAAVEYDDQIPCVMARVGGIPYLSHLLASLKRNRITDLVLVCGRFGERIERRYGDGARHGLRIRYFHDPEDAWGQAGALRAVENWLSPSFFVVDASRFQVVDFESLGAAFVENGLPSLMAVWENCGAYRVSNCALGRDAQGRTVIKQYDSEGRDQFVHVDYGASIWTDELLDRLPDGYCSLEAVFRGDALRGRIAVYTVRQRFYDARTDQGLRELRAALLSGAAPDYVHLL